MNNTKNLPNRVIVSAILEKIIDNKLNIFIQTRWKPQTSPTYTGMIEIPAGGVNPYENIYDAVCREVKEETGLTIIKYIDNFQSEITENRHHDKNHVFSPFICQQSLKTEGGLPWIGFVFRCRVKGKIVPQKEEVKDPRWITIQELKNILEKKPETVFPLQYPVLKYYLNTVKNL